MRHLPIVINQLIELVPEEETGLLHDLQRQFTINEYRAPEICDWAGTSNTLQLHLAGREKEPWVSALLDVWQDKPAKVGSDLPWMDEARQFASQCWCDDETRGIEMDMRIAEAVAKRIAVWMDTAARSEGNTDYYRGLLIRCGKAIGDRAYLCDDGSRSDEVLCAKIPEIVECDYVNGGG